MSLVASNPGGEACVCDLNDAFDLSQPTISHHLKVLHDAGLVDREKRGVWAYYRIRPEALTSLSALMGCGPAVTICHDRKARTMTSQAELTEVRDRVRARYARAAHTVTAGGIPSLF